MMLFQVRCGIRSQLRNAFCLVDNSVATGVDVLLYAVCNNKKTIERMPLKEYPRKGLYISAAEVLLWLLCHVCLMCEIYGFIRSTEYVLKLRQILLESVSSI